MTTKQLLEYQLDVVSVSDFKEYYDEHIYNFTVNGQKAFLKSADIPPAYFLEQPEDTQKTLLVNKDYLIKNSKKYEGKCIVVLWKDNEILNACKMTEEKAELAFEQLSTISEVESIIWDRTFYRDGYVQGFIPTEDIKKGKFTRCIVIDFPIMLNKPAVIHDAFYKMPTEDSIVDADTFYYNSSSTVDFLDYQHIALAVNDAITSVSDEVIPVDASEPVMILRESDEIVTSLLEDKIIPKSIGLGLINLMNKTLEFETLTQAKLVDLILSFSLNIKPFKQVTNLRNCFNWVQEKFNREKEVVAA